MGSLLVVDFQWRLTIRHGARSRLSAYALSQTPNGQATPINIGDLVAGEITAPGEAGTYEFGAIAEQVVFLDRTVSSNPNGLNWKLEDRFGRIPLNSFGARRVRTDSD